MEFKCLSKKLILENDKIILKILFNKEIIFLNEITHLHYETPKYNTLNTCKLDFCVYIYIFKKNNKLIKYNMVLLEEEIKQFQNYLDNNHISNSQQIYDNKIRLD